LACDVTDDESVATLVERVLAEAGRIDLLVNNAGMGLLGAAEESSTVQPQALFDVNVFGVLRVTSAVLPSMRHRGKGRIVNVSSMLGLIPAPTPPSMRRPSMPLKAIPNHSTTRFAPLAFAWSWSSPPIHGRPSKKTSPDQTDRSAFMTPRALA
jgi:NAD(P)-dependent dehydrogenase (short-subunit alcohol dehydrogenase family)